MMPTLSWTVDLPRSQQWLWDFHCREDALQLLTPPQMKVRLLRHDHPLREGGESLLSVPLLPFVRAAWLARIMVFEPPYRFVDEQIDGPFAAWRHEHIMEATAAGSRLTDRVTVRPRLYQWPGWLFIKAQLNNTFGFRHAVMQQHAQADAPPQASEHN